MRVSFLALSAGLILASLPTASDAQRADNDIFPRSIALQQQGQAAQEAGDLNLAVDFYESALAADPRNRSAIIALAQVARAQGLPGKAIGLYREALV
ncbi:MAG: tetratricopeptide repeat protein, partial [Sphingopyxis sp.]